MKVSQGSPQILTRRKRTHQGKWRGTHIQGNDRLSRRFDSGFFEGFISTAERKKKEVMIEFQPVSLELASAVETEGNFSFPH